MALTSPLFQAVASLAPSASIADMGAGTLPDAVKFNWLGATFVTYAIEGKPWTIRFDSGVPPTQEDVDAALGAP